MRAWLIGVTVACSRFGLRVESDAGANCMKQSAVRFRSNTRARSFSHFIASELRIQAFALSQRSSSELRLTSAAILKAALFQRPIIRVNFYIVDGKIAGENAGSPAAHFQINGNFELGLLENSGGLGLDRLAAADDRFAPSKPVRTQYQFLSGSSGTPARPAAARILPQLASSPKRAVLVRLELAIVSAILWAS